MAGPKILSLFSGVGGLEVAVSLALPESEVVGYVERDAYASAALMARMEESSMDLAPIFCGDIRQLDGRPLRGHVDVVCGGIPCQPYSVAGAQQGNEDDRALWPEFARIVEECGPALVFIENVPTFVTGAGFRPLGEELSRMGYEIADPLFIGAGDVGAPHVRRRVFILAYRDLDRREVEWGGSELVEGEREAQRNDTDGCDEGVGDTDSARRETTRQGRQEHSGPEPETGSEPVADASPPGLQGNEQRDALSGDGHGPEAHGSASELRGPSGGTAENQRVVVGVDGIRPEGSELANAQGGSVGRGEVPDAVSGEVRDESERGGGGAQEAERGYPVAGDLGLFPPGPDDFETWGAVIDIAPHLVPAIEPGLRCVVDGVSVVLDESRADQIRCAGNAVVVAQAYVAFRQLMEWVKGKDDV